MLKFKKRIGVFVCHCGTNIGGVVDVAKVVRYALTLPGVIYAEENLYTCSEAGISSLKSQIDRHSLTRVVVASCTPRTHEPLFRDACEEAGLNRYLFEFVNIREHCSWIHSDNPKVATEKAKDLVAMGVAKATHLEERQDIVSEVIPVGLVIGGGVAGMSAALNLARQGFKVHLVERENQLGGTLKSLYKLFPDGGEATEVINRLRKEVQTQRRIIVHLGSELTGFSGFVGDFSCTIGDKSKQAQIKVGTVIVATGAQELKPFGLYGYGRLKGVLTQGELEAMFQRGRWPRANNVVMIGCVGARGDGQGYCGRICCVTALKNAILLSQLKRPCSVTILHRDIAAYGEEYELYYRRALELGIRFIRFDPERPPHLIARGKRPGCIKVYDSLAGEEIQLPAEFVVLSTPLVTRPGTDALAKLLKVPVGRDRFFLEAHPKLRPVEFAAAGIFLAGAARFCADVRETVAQAGAAATKAGTLMSARKVKVDAITAWVDEPSCSGCARCESACNFGAIRLETTYEGRRVAKVNHVLCKGCGGCVALCPNRAIQQHGFSDQQLLCMIEAMLSGEYLEPPRLLVFACNWCAYAGADLAGILRLNTPQDFRIIRVMCSCRVGAELVVAALCKGVDGVLILGCHPGECHYGRGNYFARRRGLILKRLLQRFGFEPERFNLGWVSASEGHRFSQMVKESIHRLRKIGLSRIKRDAGYTTLGS